MWQCLINAFLCPHGQGGGGGLVIADMGGGGVNFLQFCADVFYEQPLMQKTENRKFSVTAFQKCTTALEAGEEPVSQRSTV